MKKFGTCIAGHDLHLGRYATGGCIECCREKNQIEYNKTGNWRKQRILNQTGEAFTNVDYDRFYQVQGGSCAICHKHQSELTKRLHVDHDHSTGKARGLLCEKCNIVIMQTLETYAHLISAGFEYLNKERS